MQDRETGYYPFTGAGFVDSHIIRVLGEQGLVGWLLGLYVIMTFIFTLNKVENEDCFVKSAALGAKIALFALLAHSLNSNTFLLGSIMFPFCSILGILFSMEYVE